MASACVPSICCSACRARILLLDDADDASIQAARWAKKAGRTVVFDGTWSHENLGELLSVVDVPIVSEPLMQRWLPDLAPEEVVQKLCDYGAELAVYTLGERGCIARWQNQSHFFSSFPVDIVDTTGAGDAMLEQTAAN